MATITLTYPDPTTEDTHIEGTWVSIDPTDNGTFGQRIVWANDVFDRTATEQIIKDVINDSLSNN